MADKPRTPTFPLGDIKVPLFIDEELSTLLENLSGGTKRESVRILSRMITDCFDEFKPELRGRIQERDIEKETEGAKGLSDEALLAELKSRGHVVVSKDPPESEE